MLMLSIFSISYTLFYMFGWILFIQYGAISHIFGYHCGSLLMFLNILVLIWAWRRIFVKKSIALAAGVIVLKYALLVWTLYVLVQSVDPLALVLGISVFIPALFSMALFEVFFRKGEDGPF